MNKTEPIYWKWSLGTTYERSRRIVKQEKEPEKQIKTNQFHSLDEQWTKDESWTKDEEWNKEEFNVREDTYNRMSQREWTVQTGVNPYSTNNYIDDLIVQEQYLKPINSQQDKLKAKEDEKISSYSFLS